MWILKDIINYLHVLHKCLQIWEIVYFWPYMVGYLGLSWEKKFISFIIYKFADTIPQEVQGVSKKYFYKNVPGLWNIFFNVKNVIIYDKGVNYIILIKYIFITFGI